EEPYPSQVPNRWIPPVQPQALRLAQPRRGPVPDPDGGGGPGPRDQPSHNQAGPPVPAPAPVPAVHPPPPPGVAAGAHGAAAELWSLEEPPSVGDVALHVTPFTAAAQGQGGALEHWAGLLEADLELARLWEDDGEVDEATVDGLLTRLAGGVELIRAKAQL